MYNIKKSLETIVARLKSSWTYKNPLFIVIATLVVVILWQNFIAMVPVFNNDVIAYNEPGTLVHCDERCLLIAWTDLRTTEIMNEQAENFRRASRLQAQLELNEMIIEL